MKTKKGRPKGSKNKPKISFSFDSEEYKKGKSGKSSKSSSSSKQLALPSPDAFKKKLSQVRDIGDATVVFKKESKKIRDFIESKEDDSAVMMAQRGLLSMLIDLIPVAEASYRNDPRQGQSVALNSLISQIRELIHDIQSTSDRARVADSIVYNIIQPMMLSFGQFVVDNNYQTKRDLSELVDVRQKRELDSVMNKQAKALGSYMQTFFEDIKTRITKELSE